MIKYARNVKTLGYRAWLRPDEERTAVGLAKLARAGEYFERIAIDPRSHYYIDSWAVSAYEKFGLNENDDGFEREQLQKNYRTFVGSWVCLDHENWDESLAVGTNIDAVYMPDDYVRVAMGVHRERSEERRPGLEARIDRGEVTDTSMGVFASSSMCTIPTCANVATDESQFCDHVRHRHLGGLRGTTVCDASTHWKKVRAGELNRGLYFFENTVITSDEGADRNAKIIAKLASDKKKRFEVDALFRAVRDVSQESGPAGRAVLAKLIHRLKEELGDGR